MYSLKLENDKANIVDINDEINYVVIGASGLNPPSASLFTSKSPNRKGLKYNGSSLDERIVILTIKFLGDIEENRNRLYGWIDTEQYCKIHYTNGLKDVYCEGYVTECPIDLFTNNEVVSVAILCPNPYWKEMNSIVMEISALQKQFTFPFAIDAEGVPFSTLKETTETSIFNGGAETGAQFRIICKEAVSNLTIYDATDVTKKITIGKTLAKNSVVIIDTEANPKTCKEYKADGKTINLLKYIKKPTWFTLKKGTNIFGYTASSDLFELTISFTNKYLGV
jgi:hypothetical protein